MTKHMNNRPTPGPREIGGSSHRPSSRQHRGFPTEILPAEFTESTDAQKQIFKADGPVRPLLAFLVFIFLVFTTLAALFALTQNVLAEFKLARTLFQETEPKDNISQGLRRFLPQGDRLEGEGGNDFLNADPHDGHDHSHDWVGGHNPNCNSAGIDGRTQNTGPSRLYAFVSSDLEDVPNAINRTCDVINVFVPEWCREHSELSGVGNMPIVRFS